jgi:hypothetical protein
VVIGIGYDIGYNIFTGVIVSMVLFVFGGLLLFFGSVSLIHYRRNDDARDDTW